MKVNAMQQNSNVIIPNITVAATSVKTCIAAKYSVCFGRVADLC